MRYFYEQKTGHFGVEELSGGQFLLSVGYAGKGTGRNNPAAQDQRSVGPLPRGQYLVHDPVRHPRLGALAFRLSPYPANQMHDRSGFFIHGDNKTNDASEGCIIIAPTVRRLLELSDIRELIVR